MTKEKPLNMKKFWVRDYDLTDFKQQVEDGLDDCVIHEKDVASAVEKLKEKFPQAYQQNIIDSIFGEFHSPQTKPTVVLHSNLGRSRLSDGTDKTKDTRKGCGEVYSFDKEEIVRHTKICGVSGLCPKCEEGR